MEPAPNQQPTPPNAPPSAPVEAAGAIEHPRYTITNIIAFAFIGFVLLGWFLPAGNLAPVLTWPIIIFGGAAGVAFLVRCINEASKARNTFVKVFLVLCGLGIGFVIFCIGVFSGIVAGFKDPDVRMS